MTRQNNPAASSSSNLSANMYREQILDLFKNPLHFGKLDTCTHEGHKHNPSCGDEFTVQLIVEKGKIADAHFYGSGCAISTASASLLTDTIIGTTVADAASLSFEDMSKLLGIQVSSSRITCVTLSLDCLKLALESPHAKGRK